MAWTLEPTAMGTGVSTCLHTEMAMPRGPQRFLGLGGFPMKEGPNLPTVAALYP